MTQPKGIFRELKYDGPAGLVVFLVALPLCLGIALASGAPLFSGLIAGIVGGIVVASFSGSPLSVSGPAAGLTAIVLSALTDLGSFDIFLMAVVLAGAMQVALGFAKAGIIGYYFPSGVIKGMLAAIGLILILTQIPHALGYDVKAMADEVVDMVEQKGRTFPLIEGIKTIWLATQNYELGAIIISLVSLAILIVWDTAFLKKYQFFKLVPGALIAVVVGTLLNQLFIASAGQLALGGNHLVVLPVADSPQAFISFFTLPDFSSLTNPKVYIVAVTLALVASIESLLSVEAADKLDPYKRNTPTNQELKAQGIGNMISGLIGGLPITAVIVRSSANINSGARTKMSAIIHGFLLLACAIFIPNILNLIPLSCLAALLLTVGYKLAKISLFKEMYHQGWRQLAPFLTTIIVILMTNLLVGIGVGMVLAIFFILKDNYKTPYFFKHDDRTTDEVYLLELSEHVSFLNKGSIQLTLDNLPKGAQIVIDGTKTVQIDYDVQEVIYNFWSNANQREITVELKNVDFSGFKPSSGH